MIDTHAEQDCYYTAQPHAIERAVIVCPLSLTTVSRVGGSRDAPFDTACRTGSASFANGLGEQPRYDPSAAASLT